MLLYKINKISLTTKLAVLLSAVLIALACFLAYTAPGLAWMLNANMDDPTAKISVSSVSNKFYGTTTINDLRYESDFADIQFERVTIKWNPLSIFFSQLIIDDLSGEHLRVNFKTKNNDANLKATLTFPKSTHVIAAAINGLELKSNGEPIYAVNRMVIDNIFLDDSYFADNIVLKSADGQWVKLSGQFGFSATSVINLTTDSSLATPSNRTGIRAKGTLVGNAAQLRFLQHVSAPFTADIAGRIKHLFTNPSWDMDSKLNAIDLSVFSEGKFLKNLSGDVSIRGQWDRFQVISDLNVRDFTDNVWAANLTGHSNDNLLEFEIGIRNSKPQNGNKNAHASINGSYDLKSLISASPMVQGLNIKGQWAGITVPLNAANTVIADAGNIEFDGSNFATKINAEGVLLNTLGPTINSLALNTKKDGNGEIIFSGLATSPNGKLQLSGSMVKRNNSYELDNLFLSGNNFPLVRKPQAHIIVSPNLSFVRKGGIMTSTGTVDIPTANIQLQDFKNTLATISSVVDVGHSLFDSSGYVDVKFGKSVWLHGYGLNAHVTGDLSVLDISDRQIIASGELNVLRGNYRKLNEEHPLSGGRLTFNNHDLDNPQLELKIKKAATSSSGKITGGLQKLFKDSTKNVNVKSSVESLPIHYPLKKVALSTYP